MPTFDKSEGALLYVQVSDFVREKIYSKDWGVDEPIPSEHELMGMLHLSRGTVQRASASSWTRGSSSSSAGGAPLWCSRSWRVPAATGCSPSASP